MNSLDQQPEKSPASLREESILKYWEQEGVFQKTLSKESPKGEYIFFDGPPTANGKPAIHHMEGRSFKDIIPRYKTMQGFHVSRKAGWDTHGLPVELEVEKQLGLRSKKEIENYGIAEFNQKCRESVWKYVHEWEDLTKRVGYWEDMNHPYVTYYSSYIEACWGVIKKAEERKLLYKDFKVLPWCTRCGTPLSSHELNQPGAYKDVKDLSVTVKFKIVGAENGYFLAWTTTPWTLAGNVGLAVGKDIDYVEAKKDGEVVVLAKDRISILPEGYEIIAEHKGSEMIGMQYEPLFPFLGNLLPEDQKEKLANAYKIYPADFVTTTDGTGIVHTAVMYGAEDFDLGTQVGLPKFHLVNEEGNFVSGTGFLEGRYVKEKNEDGKPTLAVDVIDDLKKRNLFFKQENVTHSYPHCWRCDTPLLYYARTSWYFNMKALRDQMVTANQSVHWEPEHIRDGRFGEWLDGIKDWAISRDRYWGTPIPVWETADGKNRIVIGSLDDLKKLVPKSTNNYFVMRHGESEANVIDVWDFGNAKLTEKGKEQVALSAEDLRDKGITRIVTSPYIRTMETGDIIAKELGIPKEKIESDKRLIEWQVGNEFDQTSIQDFRDRVARESVDYYKECFGGETYRQVVQRAGAVLADLEKKYQGETILIVSHGSVCHAMDFVALGKSQEDGTGYHTKEKNLKNAEIRKIDYMQLPRNEFFELDFHKPYIDQIELVLDGQKLVRTPEVMDVWFDSGCMPYAQNHVLGQPIDFSPKPADFLAEGLDQTRGWFYTLHAIANIISDTPAQAYKNVICYGLLMDASGIKMSKSKGNVVDPWAIFNTYGADAVRLWMYSVNQSGESKNFDEKALGELHNKFFRTLENCVQILTMYSGNDVYPIEDTFEDTVMETWARSLMAQTHTTITKSLDSYDMFTASRALRDFVTELSQWYIRRSRENVREHQAVRAFLRSILSQCAIMSAPFVPFMAEWLWKEIGPKQIREQSVHMQSWGDLSNLIKPDVMKAMEETRKIVSIALEARQRTGIKVRQHLAWMSISNPSIEFKEGDGYYELILDELNVKKIVYVHSPETGDVLSKDHISFETNISEELIAEGNARELVRKIQEMRKEANLVPTDKVRVSLSDSEPEWFTSYKQMISETVGANEVVWGVPETKVEKI